MTSPSVNPNAPAMAQDFRTSVRVYAAGDKVERYNPGQSIASSNKSYTLLFFEAQDMVFPAAFATRIQNHFARNNLVYIGDIVTQSLEDVARDRSSHINLGVKSKEAVSAEILRMGLNFNLNVAGGWPPGSPECIRKDICAQADLRYSRGSKLQKYLARLSLDAA